MKNRIKTLFERKKKDILNVYFTAGYPHRDDTPTIAIALSALEVDLIEIGLPYSDPLADGTTIQESSQRALANGITLATIFRQIDVIRQSSQIPIILMGYYNQLLQYGPELFLDDCALRGVDALIIPDLPMDDYEQHYKSLFEERNLGISFLITPETSDERIHQADRLSSAFIYVVSKSSITGAAGDLDEEQLSYFRRINSLHLASPRLVGFGIHDQHTYQQACHHAQGAIIGSAFIRQLSKEGPLIENITTFITSVRG